MIDTEKEYKTWKDIVLLDLATTINPVKLDLYTISDAAKRIGCVQRVFKDIVNKLLEEKVLMVVKSPANSVSFPSDEARVELILKNLRSQNTYNATIIKSGSLNFLDYKLKTIVFNNTANPIPDYSFFSNKLSFFDITFLAYAVDYQEFSSLFHLLAKEEYYLRGLFVNVFNCKLLNLMPINYESFDLAFKQNPIATPDFVQFVDARLDFYRYCLSGRLSDIPNNIPADSKQDEHHCIYGVYYLYKGDINNSIKSFSRGQRNNVDFIDYNPIYQFLLAWAIYRDESGKEHKGLMKHLNSPKSTYYSWFRNPVSFLLKYVLEGNDKKFKIRDVFNTYDREPPMLAKVLLWFMLKHFSMLAEEKQKVPVELQTFLLRADHAKLLRFECSQEFEILAPYYSKYQKELDLEPAFPKTVRKEKWEMALEKVLDIASGIDKGAKKAAATADNRIIYRYNPHNKHLQPVLQNKKANNSWSGGRNIALSTLTGSMPEKDDFDRKVCECISEYIEDYYWQKRVQYIKTAKALFMLADSGKVYNVNTDEPMTINRVEPEIQIVKSRKGFILQTNLADVDLSEQYVIAQSDNLSLSVACLTTKQRELIKILREQKDFPLESEDLLRKTLPQLCQHIVIQSDMVVSNEDVKKVEANSMITALMQPAGGGLHLDFYVKPLVTEPPYCRPAVGNIVVNGTLKGERVQAVRSLDVEKKNFDNLLQKLQHLLEQSDDDISFSFSDPYDCLDLLEVLSQNTDCVRVEWPQGAQMTIKGQVDFENLKFSLGGKGKWFEVEGDVKINAESFIKMSELLAKLRESRGRFIELSNGEFLAITENLRKRLLQLEGSLQENKGKLMLPAISAFAMADFSENGSVVEANKTFNNMLRKINEAAQRKYSVPSALQAELREYQIDGFKWMSRLADWGAGACLADDMGLGKTLQSIALMLSRSAIGPSIVIAPTSVLLNWKNEFQRFAPSLNVLILNEIGCDRKAIISAAKDHDVVLTTYGVLVIEVADLKARTWNVIVLDEAHTIKNSETKMSKAAMQLSADFRLMLTGTPLQNHLGEIWNLFSFATPGLLGSKSSFEQRFVTPIERDSDRQRQQTLKRLLQPFILRRTKNEVLDELPEKTEITLRVELSPDERALYEKLRIEAIDHIENERTSAMQTLAEILRLRQAACNPRFVEPDIEVVSSKTKTFLELVDELIKSRHRALVFSQFTSHLALVREQLDARGIEYLYLDGSTSTNARAQLVNKFQKGSQPLFLISLKAGGLGLNLTAADFVIHMDPWWNPAIEDQASDRAYRIGQTRPVTVYRLIASQTIEEKIVRLHQTKKSLADLLLEGSNMSHKLTREEMLDLLRERD